jgi:hypothetical protein
MSVLIAGNQNIQTVPRNVIPIFLEKNATQACARKGAGRVLFMASSTSPASGLLIPGQRGCPQSKIHIHGMGQNFSDFFNIPLLTLVNC